MPANHSAPFLSALWVFGEMPGAVPVLPEISEPGWLAYQVANDAAEVPGAWVSPVRISTASRATCGEMTCRLSVRGTWIGSPLLVVIDLIGAGALYRPSLATAAYALVSSSGLVSMSPSVSRVARWNCRIDWPTVVCGS